MLKKTLLFACLIISAPAFAAENSSPLRIMASPLPHAEILNFVQQRFPDGPKLEVIEITGQMNPNGPLAAGDIDANYFQHLPYLQTDQPNYSEPLKVVATVHLEPLGLYSSRYDQLDALPDGARIGVPDNPSNLSRALFLLQSAGLLRLKPGLDAAAQSLATEQEIGDNPHHYRIVPIDAPLLARALPDLDAAVINGNFALEAGLSPAEDALILERAEHNPYANVLVTRADLADDPRIQALARELESADVAQFIRERYQGAVLPVRSGN